MDIKVTLTATPELLEALNNIATAFSGKSAGNSAPAKTNLKSVKKDEEISEPETGSEENTDQDQEYLSLETVRELLTAKTQGGKRDKVKKLLTEFGVAKLTELDSEKYPAFYKKLQAI